MKKIDMNLIPDTVNMSPDYYCTWQTQLYTTCDGKPAKQREIVSEKGLFGKEKPYGWADFYEQSRRDLFIVADDGWDVPMDGDRAYYGSLLLNKEKFPEATKGAKTNAEALKNITERIKELGWKGFGLWVCAQESEKKFSKNITSEEYWKKAIQEAHEAGISYWKVDWGEKINDVNFRRMLTETGKKFAPKLIIEHAKVSEIIPNGDVFRTYDVPAIMSIPMTMKKLHEILADRQIAETAMGLINCEDEVYIAAAGGFTMGIMRHPYSGAFIDGREDMSFPTVHRNLKTKMYEVVRSVRWHRIAPAFGVDGNVNIDESVLTDYWEIENKNAEIESWWLELDLPEFNPYVNNDVITISATKQIARRCKMAEVIPDKNGNVPYVVTSKNPNGAFSVLTLGRTLGRVYEIPECDVTINAEGADIIGVFGEYEKLIIKTDLNNIKAVFMQDLADETAYDITDDTIFENEKIIIPGQLIHRIGTMAQPEGDTSEPGVVVKFITD